MAAMDVWDECQDRIAVPALPYHAAVEYRPGADARPPAVTGRVADWHGPPRTCNNHAHQVPHRRTGEERRPRVLRALHTADVHLGARHADLGPQASAQRERQFAAFRAAIDLAIAERVDLVLIAGDLFDSNTQPRRSVERVAAELARLAAAKIRTVIVPGTHDVYDRASIYRAYDLAALAGQPPDSDLVTVLTPERPSVHLAALDAIVYGPVFETKRAPHPPLQGIDAAATIAPPGRSASSTARSVCPARSRTTTSS
ncbi:MAG: hypothetical protein KatS3mg065_0069 [Chloroflexota bacterium]|nr:MAG: hypothetical protein KatS3mg065_0069 [Chloroflexota bacterium]